MLWEPMFFIVRNLKLFLLFYLVEASEAYRGSKKLNMCLGVGGRSLLILSGFHRRGSGLGLTGGGLGSYNLSTRRF